MPDINEIRLRDYQVQMENAEFGERAAKLEVALKDLDQGKRSDAYPLVHFGWKDADLDPEGSTGIEAIVKVTEDDVTLRIGGHKSYGCDGPENLESDQAIETYREIAQEIISADYLGECSYADYDGWGFSFNEELTVEWQCNDTDIDYTKTAEMVIEKTKEAVKPMEETWAFIAKALDTLYEDAEEGKYGE